MGATANGGPPACAALILLFASSSIGVRAMKEEQQLFEDLLYLYNKLARPVKNASEVVVINFGASLIRIIDVDEKNQVLTTNLWLEMQWTDWKLVWNPTKYGGIKKLHIPADFIWTPDILLYNCADGHPQISINTDALVYYDGKVMWKPPGIYKSFCQIDIQYFPYDLQRCHMKFGGWTYNGFYLDMRQIETNGRTVVYTRDETGRKVWRLKEGMDLSYFYESSEWDLLELSSDRHEVLYPGCCGQDYYIDITFYITLRRKALFYTVNLVVPCTLIAIWTTFVFYLPACCREKITFSISVLVALIVFFLVLVDLIPPTSLVIPFMAKYLLFTLTLVTVSIIVTVVTLDINHRDGATHKMPKWMRWLFLRKLPRLLRMKLPQTFTTAESWEQFSKVNMQMRRYTKWLDSRRSPLYSAPVLIYHTPSDDPSTSSLSDRSLHSDRGPICATVRSPNEHLLTPQFLRRMIKNVHFIATHIAMLEYEEMLSDEWSYVASVIDRLFLIIFSVVNVFGTVTFVVQSSLFHDDRTPLPVPRKTHPLGGDTVSHLY
uniref:Neurotransmitter-gated ion-channel ligand-binding domain-containing protein n=1 Tax=Trichuris muris TaxID=70415 RepID=A0A5S6R535_TRIMR